MRIGPLGGWALIRMRSARARLASRDGPFVIKSHCTFTSADDQSCLLCVMSGYFRDASLCRACVIRDSMSRAISLNMSLPWASASRTATIRRYMSDARVSDVPYAPSICFVAIRKSVSHASYGSHIEPPSVAYQPLSKQQKDF